MKIIDYEVVYGSGLKSLKEAVKILRGKGWLPQGGICVVFNPERLHVREYYQAMVKPETLEDIAKEIGIDFNNPFGE